MSKSATILVVEDDQSMLDGINDLLQVVDLGYNIDVHMAENGRVGLQVLQQHVPDLIVSDIMMPEMEGYEFLKHVRQNTQWIQIPFIFLTAKGSRHDVHRGRVSGADLYITKPFNSMEFLELVKSQLDRAFQLRSIRQQIANNLKKDILQILNHEFRTPLTYVTAYYEMLADGLPQLKESGDFYEYLRGIQVGCVRLTRLVDDFIKILDVRSGKMKKRFRKRVRPLADVNALVRKSIHANEDLAREYEVGVEFVPAPSLPTIHGDAQGLEEVFFQLLNNAIKFTHRRLRGGGTVTIKSGGNKEEVTVSFSDQGVGIPATEYDKLYQLFYQYNRGLLEQQGSGIGLTIARALVELHHGRIEIESEVGNGSTFAVTIPTNQRQLDPPPVPDDRHGIMATILVVEDDPHLLTGLKELLEICPGEYDLRVLTATNGRLGLEVLSNHQPDLIISDIMMPEMDGYEFLSQVREKPEWIQIPFIFLTAKGDRREIHRGRRSGAEEYITKPYDSDELIELVLSQLDRHFQIQDVVSRDFDMLKRSILNLVTPDFLQPLSTVTEYSGKLAAGLEEAKTEDELKASLEGIKTGSQVLVQLVEDVISLAELKTGEAETAFELRARSVSNLGVYLYDAVQAHMREAEERGIFFQFALDPDLPTAFSDTSLLLDLLQRLVKKIIDYCGEIGECEVILRSYYDEGEVRLAASLPVRLPPAEKRAFWGERAEIDTEILPQYPSISIIRGIMDLHQGQVTIHETADTTQILLSFPEYKESDAL